MRLRAVLACCCLGPLWLAACATPDFERPGTWRATGVNDANLRAMVVDPADLRRGVEAPTAARGQAAAAAVTQLESGRRPPLPDSRVSRIGAVMLGASSPGGDDGR